MFPKLTVIIGETDMSRNTTRTIKIQNNNKAYNALVYTDLTVRSQLRPVCSEMQEQV